jgi:molybdenum cofactor biosynthesis enzyme MoaA
MSIDRISIELTNKCQKGCWFCYNHSHTQGATVWQVGELLNFVGDCAAATVKAVSFGGGEPLEYPGWQEVLAKLRGVLFRSLTTNGLPLLDRKVYSDLLAAAPDKVHVSIHFPQRLDEVRRVVAQVQQLARDGIKSGINLLVARSTLQPAIEAAQYVRKSGIENDRIVYLPMRGSDTPMALEMAQVAGGNSFQSMTCLTECGRSPRFCSVGWDKSVAWCSYTTSRRKLQELTYRGLMDSLCNLDLRYCGHEQVA